MHEGSRNLRARRLVTAALAALAWVATLPSAAPAIAFPTYLRTVGGPGQAEIYPSGVAVDAAGNVWVADTGNDRIVKYPAGSTTPDLVVGSRGRPVEEGSFSNPRDIAVSATNVYVADTDNQMVQVLDLQGAYLGKLAFGFKSPIGVTAGTDGAGGTRILISDGVTGNVEVFDPSGAHVLTIPPRSGPTAGTRDAVTDSAGNIYVADYRFDKVQKYDRFGTWLLEWGGSGAPPCQRIPRPYGVAVDDADRVYVVSSGNNLVKSFTPDGSCVRTYGTRGTDELELSQSRRVAVGAGPDPKVYVADLWGIKVLVYNQDGTLASPARLGSWPKPGAGGLNEAHAVAVTSQHVYIIDTVNQRAQRFDLDGSNPLAWGIKGTGSGTATFNWPQGIAVNPATGQVWVADTRNNRLLEFPPEGGDPLRTLGGLGTGPGQFNWPMSLSFDPAGNMYVADTFNHRIQSFGPDLSFRWKYGKFGPDPGELRKPWDAAYDPAGSRVLVADTLNSRIVALDPTTGAELSVLPIEKGSTPGRVLQPMGIGAAADGSIWVADTGNNRIQRFTPEGLFANEMLGGVVGSGNTDLNFPVGIEFGPDGLLYVADTYNNRVQVFQPAQFDPQYQGQIYDPAGVAPLYPAGGTADGAGNRYVADSGGSRIVKLDPSGEQTTVSDQGWDNPRDLELDEGTGTLWVLDTGDNQVVEIATDGTVLKTFGGNTSYVKAPFGIDVTGSGVYIADTYNNRIIKIAKADGTRIWSRAACFGFGLSRPRGIESGSDGRLYAADTDNNRLVILDPPTGACLGAFGSKGSGPGQLGAPRSIANDGAGGLWVAEAQNYRLQHLTNDGVHIAQTTGGRGTGPGQFLAPACVFMDQGMVDACDTFAYKILRFAVDGDGVPSYSSSLGGTPPAPSGFNEPFGVAFGPAGELYVTDMFNHRVQKFAPDGTFKRQWGVFGSPKGSFQFPRGIAVSLDGQTVVVTNSENNRIDLFTPTGTFIQSIKPLGTTLGWPHQTAPAADGTFWIADTNKHRIIHLAADGTVLSSFTNGGTIRWPRGIAIDDAGNIYVSNTGANKVEKYAPDGTLLATLATLGSGPTQVKQPWNLFIVGSGAEARLFVADGGNNRILVMTTSGDPIATLGGPGSGPGQFSSPRSVAVSPADGSIAVADFDNDRISLWQ